MSCLQINLFGEFRVRFNQTNVENLSSNRLKSLLVYLLIHRHEPQSRQQIAFLLWPETTEKQSRTNLRNLIFQLRNAFPPIDDYLLLDRKTIQWKPDAQYTLDIAEFEALIEPEKVLATDALPAANHLEQSRLTQAATLYKGDLVPDLYDDWIIQEREKYRTHYIQLLQNLSTLLEEKRSYQEAIEVTMTLLRADPLREATYRRLMQLHSLCDDRAAALTVYKECETTLREELAVEPGSKTVELRDRLLSIAEGMVEPGEQSAPSLRPLPASSQLTPLIGRHAEWRILKDLWQLTEENYTQCVVLSGEAGIGKTRLAEELATWVHHQGGSVTISHCYTAQQSIPYSPVVNWLRSAPLQSALSTVDEQWLAEASRLLPELADESTRRETASAIHEPWQRRHLFDALIQIVGAAQQPLLLIVDDIQWADIESLEWLAALLRESQFGILSQQTKTPVLVLCTQRTEESDISPFLKSWINDLKRYNLLTTVELNPLSSEETLALGSSVSPKPLSDDEGDRLFGQTEGHPLYIVESVRAGLLTDNHGKAVVPGQDGNGLSSTPMMASVINARLNQLSSDTRAILNLASVAGREFDYATLVGTTSQDEVAVVDALDEALEKGIIREQQQDTYDFSHGKLREAVYSGLSNARRRLYHKKFATVLEEVNARQLDSVVGQLAHHNELAGNADQAINYYLRAAILAQDVYANEDALGHYQHLLSSTLAHQLTPEVRCKILSIAGQLWYAIGQWQDAISHYNELLAIARDIDDKRYQALAHLGLARVMWRQGLHEETLASLGKARPLFEASKDQIGLAQTLDTLSDVYWNRGNSAEAKEIHEQLRQLGEQIGSEPIRCRANQSLGRIRWLEGEPAEAIQLCQSAFEIAEAEQLLADKAKIALTMSGIYGSTGNYDSAWDWAMTSLHTGQHMGNQEHISRAMQNAITICGEYGDLPLTIECTLYALINSLRIRDARTTGYLINNLGVDCLEHGEISQAEELLERTQLFFKFIDSPHMLLAAMDSMAKLYLIEREYQKLETLEQEFTRLFAEVGRSGLVLEDFAITHNIMTAHLELAKGASLSKVVDTLEACLVAEQNKPEKDENNIAELHYQIWYIDPQQAVHKKSAAQLYEQLYKSRASFPYRNRYYKLTGEHLPAPPPLPVPDSFTEHEYDLESVLEQVDLWISEWGTAAA